MPTHSPAQPTLDFDAQGHPVSPRFGDVYKSRAGALAEARSVFVDGCGIVQDWQGRTGYTILELGFGLGVNFIATLAAWRADAARPARLHYVAIEAHLLDATQIQAAHRALGIDALATSELTGRWPIGTPGLHRIALADAQVVLTIAVGDAAAMAARLDLAADALYLDGFAPSRNPDMWTPGLMKSLARLSRPGARLATYTAAASVREALGAAGFEVSLTAGFGHKRERIQARYAPRWRTWAPPPPPTQWQKRDAIVIGGGLAGWCVAAALDRRGWRTTLLERAARACSGGSGQPALADHLHLSPDDNPLARLTRAALLLRSAHAPIGKLQVAADAGTFARQCAMVARLGYPSRFVQALDQHAASEIAGMPLAHGGLWLPMCGSADPSAIVGATPETIDWRAESDVARLSQADGLWRAIGQDGAEIASAPVVILANAGDAPRLVGLNSARLRRVRGQSTLLAAGVLPGLRTVIGGAAYACPLPDGRCLVGSSFDDGERLEIEQAADLSNLQRLGRMLACGAPSQSAVTGAALGFRYTTDDRLPVIGQIPDEAACRRQAAALQRDDRLPLPAMHGLFAAFGFGSRGLLWSTLAAEVIACLIDSEPAPIERELLAAIAPGRFLRKALRARRL